VTKKEIVRTISEEIGLTQLQTKEIVQKTFDAIVEALVAERRIELRNFGVFEVKRRAPRKARNPRTGDKVFCARKVRRHVQTGQGDGGASQGVGASSGRRGPGCSGEGAAEGSVERAWRAPRATAGYPDGHQEQ